MTSFTASAAEVYSCHVYIYMYLHTLYNKAAPIATPATRPNSSRDAPVGTAALGLLVVAAEVAAEPTARVLRADWLPDPDAAVVVRVVMVALLKPLEVMTTTAVADADVSLSTAAESVDVVTVATEALSEALAVVSGAAVVVMGATVVETMGAALVCRGRKEGE